MLFIQFKHAIHSNNMLFYAVLNIPCLSAIFLAPSCFCLAQTLTPPCVDSIHPSVFFPPFFFPSLQSLCILCLALYIKEMSFLIESTFVLALNKPFHSETPSVSPAFRAVCERTHVCPSFTLLVSFFLHSEASDTFMTAVISI